MESLHSSRISQLQQSLKSKAFELAYEQSVQRVDISYEQEKARQLRVRIQLLEDENDDLHDQLTQDDDRIDKLEGSVKEGRESLGEIENHLQCAQGELRAKSRELEVAKAELCSLNGVSTDSAKLLTEKLALSRELSSLRPELEHLRSEVASHHSILSEKLSLQRQLSTIQVELETEKRATQRALTKEGKSHEKDAKLESQIEELRRDLSKARRDRELADKEARDTANELDAERRATQRALGKERMVQETDKHLETQIEDLRKDLVKEKRERERADKDAKSLSAQSEGQKAVLESKLEAFRNKLRTTKEQLKDTQAELQEAQAAAVVAKARSGGNDHTEKPTKNPRKRTAAQLDKTAAIGTPGEAVPKRRGKRASTLPGDKSTFSITPFLNRTSVAPDSPQGVQTFSESQDEKHYTAVAEPRDARKLEASASPTAAPRRKSVKPRADDQQASKEGVLSVAKTGKSNAKAPPARRKPAVPALEKVAEEEDDENIDPTQAPVPVRSILEQPTELETATPMKNEEFEIKRKKRKLLGGGPGKTLFDEDDAESTKVPVKGLFGNKGVAALGKGGLMGSKNNLKSGLGGGFGNFSPLKKDRKIVA
ncbi:MAG: hypothetical protein M1835_007594 [Candelina submexicana]|nr:MAG: hypothetical protein M1835_007594 [Candelina submexicana]